MRTLAVTAALVLALGAGSVWAWPVNTVYVAGFWTDDTLRLHDDALNELVLFAAGPRKPNGLATDGTSVWAAHPSTREVVIYNDAGVRIGGWTDLAALAQVQGLAYVSPDLLAVATYDEIRLHHPDDGTYVRTLLAAPDLGPYTEGLAWDGEYLWRLAMDEIIATNIANGQTEASIPNPASVYAGESGNGLTCNSPGQLTVAAQSGKWWIVDTDDGSVIVDGTNGAGMYALTAVVESEAIPEPMTAAVVLLGMMPSLLIRRRRRRSARGISSGA